MGPERWIIACETQNRRVRPLSRHYTHSNRPTRPIGIQTLLRTHEPLINHERDRLRRRVTRNGGAISRSAAVYANRDGLRTVRGSPLSGTVLRTIAQVSVPSWTHSRDFQELMPGLPRALSSNQQAHMCATDRTEYTNCTHEPTLSTKPLETLYLPSRPSLEFSMSTSMSSPLGTSGLEFIPEPLHRYVYTRSTRMHPLPLHERSGPVLGPLLCHS
mgnify:CR=1 FL=1